MVSSSFDPERFRPTEFLGEPEEPVPIPLFVRVAVVSPLTFLKGAVTLEGVLAAERTAINKTSYESNENL